MGLSTRRVCGSPRGENGCWRCGGWAPTGKYGAHRGAGSVLSESKTVARSIGRFAFRSLSPLRLILRKVRRCCVRKSYKFQKSYELSTKSAKRQLWRIPSREKEYWASAALSQCGGLHAKGRVYWRFLRSRKSAENVKRGRMAEGDELTLVGAEALSPVSNNLTGGFCFKLTHGAPTLLRAKFSRHLGLDNSWWAV